jgi:hypothetical protein
MSDWPNPRGQSFPTDLRGFLDQLKLNLRSQDQFFGAAGQAPIYDWPNPRGKQHPISLRQWDSNLLETVLSIIFEKPFALSDWPNPKGRAFPVDLRTFVEDQINLVGQMIGTADHELWGLVQTAPITLDLTAALPVNITTQFGAAGPTFVCTHIIIEELP